MADLTDLDGVELRPLLQRGQISAVEVTNAYLQRISLINDQVNAIVTLDPDRALAEAERLDSSPVQARGYLHGMPIAIKDLVDTRGMRTTYGSPLYRNHVPTRDSLLVSRVRQAGAIVIGKTNTPEFGAGSHTFNRVFGATRNPWDLSLTAGGSSGGAAAALSAHLLPIADGSDLGGSLRNPASFCNVVGIRPTAEMMRVDDSLDLWDPLAVHGPMGRTVEDAALLFRVLVHEIPEATRGIPDIDLSSLRIAWSPHLNDLPIEPTVVKVLESELRNLERLGCNIDEREPDLSGSDEAFHVLRALWFVRRLGNEVEVSRDAINSIVVWNVEQGLALDAPRIARAQIARSDIYRRVASFLRNYDVLALPASAVTPFPIEVDWPREVAGVPCETYIDWMRVCTRVSVSAHPAMSIPFAFSETRLPVGLQLVGRYGDDWRLLAIARAIESAAGAAAQRPSSLAEISTRGKQATCRTTFSVPHATLRPLTKELFFGSPACRLTMNAP
jgi:amidase